MKHVKLFGVGCRTCPNALALVEDVARMAGVPLVVEKVAAWFQEAPTT